jgi:hypothetical protein
VCGLISDFPHTFYTAVRSRRCVVLQPSVTGVAQLSCLHGCRVIMRRLLVAVCSPRARYVCPDTVTHGAGPGGADASSNVSPVGNIQQLLSCRYQSRPAERPPCICMRMCLRGGISIELQARLIDDHSTITCTYLIAWATDQLLSGHGVVMQKSFTVETFQKHGAASCNCGWMPRPYGASEPQAEANSPLLATVVRHNVLTCGWLRHRNITWPTSPMPGERSSSAVPHAKVSRGDAERLKEPCACAGAEGGRRRELSASPVAGGRRSASSDADQSARF